MKTVMQFNQTRKLSALLIPVILACLMLPQRARAVSPPPDGGYANFTTAEGTNALLSLTSGAGNTGLGWSSLLSVSTGSFNTGVGTGTLVLNTADSNTAIGAAALLLNTTGTENTANGTATLVNNSIGSFNSALGAFALNNNVDGSSNTATGDRALFSNTGGDFNTANGSSALDDNTEGNANTANAYRALSSNTTGNGNTANGYRALLQNTTGDGNTAVGANALENNTTGATNTAVGANALRNVTTGSGNIALGADAGSAITANNDVICIGAPGPASVSDACFIGHIFGTTSSGGTAVFINSDGRLGTQVSSRRFKEEIKPMERVSEALFALKPVTFRYKKELDSARTPQFGLVAEEVEKVDPDLVVRDKEGKPYSVRYDQVNALLLNEFLKEHRKVQELKTTIAQQQKQIEALAAGLQKVSAQLEVIRPAPQTALNNP